MMQKNNNNNDEKHPVSKEHKHSVFRLKCFVDKRDKAELD